jgi:hypothetical protein
VPVGIDLHGEHIAVAIDRSAARDDEAAAGRRLDIERTPTLGRLMNPLP